MLLPILPPLIKQKCFVYFINGFLLIRLAATAKWRVRSLPGLGLALFACVLEASFLLSVSNFLRAILKAELQATLEPEENISR